MPGKRITVLELIPAHWARISVLSEIESAKAVLEAYRRKLGRSNELSLEDLETVTNVFKFSLLGGRGCTWRAGLRTFYGFSPNVLRQRNACLSIIVPLQRDVAIHYHDTEASNPISGSVYYGEALMVESKPSNMIQKIVLEDKDATIECLFVTYDGLDLTTLSNL